MDKYASGFVLDFAYCKNCKYNQPGLKAPVTLKENLAAMVEIWHDREKACPKRELIISYNRVMIEKVK